MRVAGIISEYNPFHSGHKFHIDETRRLLGKDTAIICAMSGNFVQRGDFAVFNKYARAEAATLCGADLVIELPAPYVLSSAERFAYGGISLLGATGVVTHVSFGSESGNLADLTKAAGLLRGNDAGQAIRDAMKSGIPYGRACQTVLAGLLGPGESDILKCPNNVLALGYLNALALLRSQMEPIAIKREGAAHDSIRAADGFASASRLRETLRSGGAPWGFMPAAAADVFKRELRQGMGPVFMENCEQALLAILRLKDKSEYKYAPDNTEGIYNRLYKSAVREASIEGIIKNIKTKRYHESRIRRMILSACIGMRADDRRGTPPYIRILAIGERGRQVLREMSTTVPIITKPAKVLSMEGPARRMFELESRVTDIFTLAYPEAGLRGGGQEFKAVPYVRSK